MCVVSGMSVLGVCTVECVFGEYCQSVCSMYTVYSVCMVNRVCVRCMHSELCVGCVW